METQQPFFSVIVPTTGGRIHNLELVLTSLKNQIFPKSMYEVIVVNDGGEQQALEVAKRFEDAFGVLKYIYTERFEPLDFGKTPDDIVYCDYTKCLCWPNRDWEKGGILNVQPRNKGVFYLADADFFIFADSDIILCPTALACYFQDMVENPDRVVLGVYHWLYPMHITPEDVTTRFDDIINERLAKYLMEEVEPSGQQTHNIMRDYRMPDFEANSPDTVFRQPGHINHALSCFSGNICWPRTIFEAIGGYTPYLHAGAHEDGYSGIDIYKHGYGISFDRRIIGGHLYHHRNGQLIESWKWERGEIPWLNEQHSDCPEMSDIIELTKQEMERLGVAGWKEKGKLGW
jgi:hypothetical protein